MKQNYKRYGIPSKGRAPHGARGLKHLQRFAESEAGGRARHGARGLKRDLLIECIKDVGRAPHGARGLKHAQTFANSLSAVAPRTGRVD